MLLARLYFDVPEDFWRAFRICIDGVAPFVSHCETVLVPWWRHGR